jgi:SagB-type dehydrogenase family enzyme
MTEQHLPANRETGAIRSYHEATKHSFASIRTSRHSLDWSNKPIPYKIYEDLEPLPLPREMPPGTLSALDALAGSTQYREQEFTPDLAFLSRVLFLSGGITKRIRYGSEEMHFRAASCTGALYHIDIYVVCGTLPGLDAGVYHFGVHDFSLRRLRDGDWRGELASASGREPSVERAPVTLVLTSTFWRNAWKYQARAYRHAFWDSGTILANLLAATASGGAPAKVVCGYVDGRVNRLLGIDGRREAALALVPVGRSDSPPPENRSSLTELGVPVRPVSRREVEYPEIVEAHHASSLHDEREVEEWRGAAELTGLPRTSGGTVPLQPLAADQRPRDPLEEVIVRRGSSRRFLREPVTLEDFSAVLEATGPVPSDFSEPGDRLLNDAYIIANAVEGVPAGSYLYRREERALELLREGEDRDRSGYLGLEQELPADAGACVYQLTDLEQVLAHFGNRGYRAAQLEAAINGGRMYLAAYALRLGATGLTFYDDDVTDHFSPSAEDKDVMFLVALGKPARRGHA